MGWRLRCTDGVICPFQNLHLYVHTHTLWTKAGSFSNTSDYKKRERKAFGQEIKDVGRLLFNLRLERKTMEYIGDNSKRKSLLFGNVSRMTGMRSLGPTWDYSLGRIHGIIKLVGWEVYDLISCLQLLITSSWFWTRIDVIVIGLLFVVSFFPVWIFLSFCIVSKFSVL